MHEFIVYTCQLCHKEHTHPYKKEDRIRHALTHLDEIIVQYTLGSDETSKEYAEWLKQEKFWLE